MTKRTLLAMVDIAHRENAVVLCRNAKEQCKPENELHIAYVMPYGYFSYIEPFVSDESIQAAAKRAHDDLNSVIAEAGIVNATPHVLRGGVGEQALLLQEKIDASMMLINAHRPGVEVHSLGAYATQIVRHASCTAMVVRSFS